MNYCPGVADLVVPQLAAVSSQAVQGGVQDERLNRGLLSVRPSQGISPHVVMGNKERDSDHYYHHHCRYQLLYTSISSAQHHLWSGYQEIQG